MMSGKWAVGEMTKKMSNNEVNDLSVQRTVNKISKLV